MARLPFLAAVAVALLVPALPAGAQSPLPIPGLPGAQPPFAEKPDCTEKGVKSAEQQLSQMEALEKTAPDTVRMICGGLDALSGFMQWKDDEPIPGMLNDLAKELLHQDVTPRMLKAMCAQAQGETSRGLRTEIGRLKDRLAACRGI